MSEGKKSLWQRAKESAGLMLFLALFGSIGSVIGIISWMGIRPETVGQTAYDAMFVIWPVLVGFLAFLAGWNCKRLLMAKKNVTTERIAELEEKRDELKARLRPYEDREAQIERSLENCGGMTLGRLWTAYNMKRAFDIGIFPSPKAESEIVYLEKLGLLEKDKETGLWFVPVDVSQRIREDEPLQDRLEEALAYAMAFEDMDEDVDRHVQAEADIALLESEPYWQKVMLACLRDKDFVHLPHDRDWGPDALAAFRAQCTEAMSRMVKTVTVGVSGTRVELTDEGVEAVYSFPDFLKDVNWMYFAAIDEETADEPELSPFPVVCGDMQWLVNVKL